MASYGGVSPYPSRAGGGSQRLQRILESLNKGRGTAYDTTATSNVYVENMAAARILDGMWSVAERMGNQFDPARLTSSLSRYERMMGLTPGANDSDAARRARIAGVRARFGQLASISYLRSTLAAALGAAFVAVETISPSVATSFWPGGTTSPYTPWSSTIDHILIRTTVPTGWTEGMYQTAVAQVGPAIDGILPAWVTWDVYRPSVAQASVNVTGGPSAAGFFLDDPLNLDNQVFDQ